MTRATTIIPFLVVKSGAKALVFYTTAFGAQTIEKHDMPGGKLVAKIAIEDGVLWLGDEEPEYNNLSPESVGGTSVRIVLTVDDPDTIFNQALQAGATQICPVTTEAFWKIGKLIDPFGHVWEIGHPLNAGDTTG